MALFSHNANTAHPQTRFWVHRQKLDDTRKTNKVRSVLEWKLCLVCKPLRCFVLPLFCSVVFYDKQFTLTFCNVSLLYAKRRVNGMQAPPSRSLGVAREHCDQLKAFVEARAGGQKVGFDRTENRGDTSCLLGRKAYKAKVDTMSNPPLPVLSALQARRVIVSLDGTSDC